MSGASEAGAEALYREQSWNPSDYGRHLVLPTTVAGETVARLALVNPRTTLDDLRIVLESVS